MHSAHVLPTRFVLGLTKSSGTFFTTWHELHLCVSFSKIASGAAAANKLQIKDATLTVNCAPCVECSPSAECPSGFGCDYTSGPSGGRKLRFGSLEIGCCRAC